MSQKLRAVFELRNQCFDAAVLHGTTAIPPAVFCEPHSELSPTWLYKPIGASVSSLVCMATASTISGIATRRIQLYEHHAPIQYVSEQLGHASIKDLLWIPRTSS